MCIHTKYVFFIYFIFDKTFTQTQKQMFGRKLQNNPVLQFFFFQCKGFSWIKTTIQGRHKTAIQETNIQCKNSFCAIFFRNNSIEVLHVSCMSFQMHPKNIRTIHVVVQGATKTCLLFHGNWGYYNLKLQYTLTYFDTQRFTWWIFFSSE